MKAISIKLKGPVAPDNMLCVVNCHCHKKCSSTACSCRKHGLQWVTACAGWRGLDCTNVRLDTSDGGLSCDPLPVDSVEPSLQHVQLLWDDDGDYLFEEEV